MLNVIVCKDYEEVSAESFKILKDVVVKNEEPVLGLATGSTPIGLYEKMRADYENGYSYSKCITYNLDEYVGIDKNHEQSYWTFMNEYLFKHIDIKYENIYFPEGNGNDIKKLPIDYEKKLKKYQIDLQILGVGTNGHIAFDEPGTPFNSKTRIVKLTEQTRKDNGRFFNSMDEVPTHAITVGLSNIVKAKKILVIVTGKHKAEAVHGMIKGPVTKSLPASILQRHKDVVVILDNDSASML